MKKILIIGGGIGGLCAAIALQRKGFEAHVYEKATVIKALGAGLSLSVNAVLALRQIGLDEELMKAGQTLRYMNIPDQWGKLITQTDIEPVARQFGAANFSIHRAVLHEILMSHLQEGSLHLGKSFSHVTQDAQEVRVDFEDGTQAVGEVLLAFDGIHSAVRGQLLPEVKPRYAGYTCWRAVIDYRPAAMQENQATETWGKAGRFGIVPLKNNKIYWFATVNAPEQDAYMRSFGVEELKKHFKEYHSPIPEILSHTRNEQLLWNDIIDLKPIGKYVFGRVVLAGDAAHATTPNMGQGACMAIEDAIVLANQLAQLNDVEKALQRYEAMRMKRTQQIVRTSYQLGKVAQWENGVLSVLRNAALRRMPESVRQKQIKELYDVVL
ncbi:FAD-dependent monooxygenase [Catalinimonas niigatensis]|uniref:FAD-dependent monooxygenase n=1 Tax=Catalinimonas niigatensis TaxID=1397264 RepID=UPI0026660782|nr:FAD-dependent monooxygenase [Catalinimonas niigatensis]WPP53210.1 FAD-dependent monooxygenase [Catalinimonas niigatensis]